MTALLAAIPSPGDPYIVSVGTFQLRWYGTLIAIGVLIAGNLAQRQLRRRGFDPEAAYTIAYWCVPGGVIGARIYHIITDWDRFSGHLERLPQLWNGGLGMPGVVVGGALGAAIGARRAGIPALVVFDCVSPGLILAQAIGRWGNYFNQELFGGPTSLPWGLEIDPKHRPDRFADSTTFHPTFLYESLWNLAVLAVLIVISRRYHHRLHAGYVFATYLLLYFFGRFWVEGLRIDPAHEIGPLRLNQWVAAIVVIGAAFWVWRCISTRQPAPAEPVPAASIRTERPGARGRKR